MDRLTELDKLIDQENAALADLVRAVEIVRRPALRPDQLEALRQFAAAQGRNWKGQLNHCWLTGHYPPDCASHLLQQVRNTFGPTWLARFRFESHP